MVRLLEIFGRGVVDGGHDCIWEEIDSICTKCSPKRITILSWLKLATLPTLSQKGVMPEKPSAERSSQACAGHLEPLWSLPRAHLLLGTGQSFGHIIPCIWVSCIFSAISAQSWLLPDWQHFVLQPAVAWPQELALLQGEPTSTLLWTASTCHCGEGKKQ